MKDSISTKRKAFEIFILFLILLTALFYRRSDAFLNPQLWAEAGTQIFQGWETLHFKSLLVVYAGSGYLITVQRIVGAVIGLLHVNYSYIPFAYNLSAFLITFFVAIALWHSALLLNIKHRILYATMFVLLPVGNELFMDEASLQWMTGIYLINYMFVWNNKVNEKYYFLTLVLLFIFSISGPYGAVLSPVILLIIFSNRKEATIKRLLPLFIILTGGIIQVVCMKFIHPEAYGVRVASWDGFEKDHLHLLKLFTKNTSQLFCFENGMLPPMSARLKTILSLIILIVLFVFFVISYRKIKDKRKYILLLSAILCFVSFIITYWPKESKILAFESARYYFLPYTCIGWLLIMAWDEKIKIIYIAAYIYLLSFHYKYLRTFLPDKKWKEQIDEYYEGKRDTIEINPDGWKFALPKK